MQLSDDLKMQDVQSLLEVEKTIKVSKPRDLSLYSKEQVAQIEKAEQNYEKAHLKYQDVKVEAEYPVAVESFNSRVRDWKLKRRYYLRELQYIEKVIGPVKAYFEDCLEFQKEFKKARKEAVDTVIRRQINLSTYQNEQEVENVMMDFEQYINNSGENSFNSMRDLLLLQLDAKKAKEEGKFDEFKKETFEELKLQ